MKASLPNTLFRFRSFESDYFSSEVKNSLMLNRVWVSPLISLNDPFEGNPHLRSQPLKEVRRFLRKFYRIPEYRGHTYTGLPLRKIARQKGHNLRLAKIMTTDCVANAKWHLRTIDSEIEKFRASVSISCFSEDLFSLLMWAYYGSSRGYCYEYTRIGPHITPGEATLQPVNYVTNRSSIVPTDLMNLVSWGCLKDERVSTRTVADETAAKLTMEKSKHWEHEKEWRLVDCRDGQGRYTDFRDYRVSSIFVAVSASSNDIDRLKKHVADRVPIKRMKIADGQYGLRVD